MKVLLTGANGFIGSHVLDYLLARQIPTAILIRPTSSRRFLETQLAGIEVHVGSLQDSSVLRQALTNVTHVIHCAGCTKAWRPADFFAGNLEGTQRLLETVNSQSRTIQRFIHFSSLAAAGPALTRAPFRESDPPAPVSIYGQSKLAAEQAVRQICKTDFVILRPPAVYGPRDTDLFKLFQAVAFHVSPRFGGGHQQLSLVYAKDLARIAVSCLTHPAARGQTFNVAAPEVVTARELAEEIARQLGVWTIPLRLPGGLLWPICLAQEISSRVTGKPQILSRLKYPELRAGAWICDTTQLRELGEARMTLLKDGITETLAWYREAGWLS